MLSLNGTRLSRTPSPMPMDNTINDSKLQDEILLDPAGNFRSSALNSADQQRSGSVSPTHQSTTQTVTQGSCSQTAQQNSPDTCDASTLPDSHVPPVYSNFSNTSTFGTLSVNPSSSCVDFSALPAQNDRVANLSAPNEATDASSLTRVNASELCASNLESSLQAQSMAHPSWSTWSNGDEFATLKSSPNESHLSQSVCYTSITGSSKPVCVQSQLGVDSGSSTHPDDLGYGDTHCMLDFLRTPPESAAPQDPPAPVSESIKEVPAETNVNSSSLSRPLTPQNAAFDAVPSAVSSESSSSQEVMSDVPTQDGNTVTPQSEQSKGRVAGDAAAAVSGTPCQPGIPPNALMDSPQSTELSPPRLSWKENVTNAFKLYSRMRESFRKRSRCTLPADSQHLLTASGVVSPSAAKSVRVTLEDPDGSESQLHPLSPDCHENGTQRPGIQNEAPKYPSKPRVLDRISRSPTPTCSTPTDCTSEDSTVPITDSRAPSPSCSAHSIASSDTSTVASEFKSHGEREDVKLDPSEAGVCAFCCKGKVDWSPSSPCPIHCPACREAHCRFELFPKKIRIEGFKNRGYLDSGVFSSVFLAGDVYADPVALKFACLRMPKVHDKDVALECRVLNMVKENPCRHLVEALGELKRGVPLKHRVMATRKCKTTVLTLLNEHGKLTSETSLEITRATLSGVHSLHSMGLSHFDIKPANLLLSEAGVRLADFGHSRETDSAELPRGGDPKYLCPELSTTEHSLNPTVPGGVCVDIFAIGKSLVHMLTGSVQSNETLGSMDSRMEACGVPKDVRTFVSGLIEEDPAKRWTFGEVLEHEVMMRPPQEELPFDRCSTPSPSNCAAHCCQAVRKDCAPSKVRSENNAQDGDRDSTVPSSLEVLNKPNLDSHNRNSSRNDTHNLAASQPTLYSSCMGAESKELSQHRSNITSQAHFSNSPGLNAASQTSTGDTDKCNMDLNSPQSFTNDANRGQPPRIHSLETRSHLRTPAQPLRKIGHGHRDCRVQYQLPQKPKQGIARTWPVCGSWSCCTRHVGGHKKGFVRLIEEELEENQRMLDELTKHNFLLGSDEELCPDYDPIAGSCPRSRSGRCPMIHDQNPRNVPRKQPLRHCKNWLSVQPSRRKCGNKCNRVHNANPHVASGFFNLNPNYHHAA